MMTKHVDSGNSHEKITAAGVCLMVAGKGTDPATTLLYLRHGDEPSLKDSLSIPCGGVQHDEEPFSAAVRELYEECMPTDHRVEFSFEKFKSDLKMAALYSEASTGDLVRGFIGREPVEGNLVLIVLVPLSRKAFEAYDSLTKLGASDKLEDYSSDTGAHEGIPVWLDYTHDWKTRLRNSRYGEYNSAFLQWLYPVFEPEAMANFDRVAGEFYSPALSYTAQHRFSTSRERGVTYAAGPRLTLP